MLASSKLRCSSLDVYREGIRKGEIDMKRETSPRLPSSRIFFVRFNFKVFVFSKTKDTTANPTRPTGRPPLLENLQVRVSCLGKEVTEEELRRLGIGEVGG